MSAPPSKSAISGTPINAEAKTAFAALWDYVVGRLGGDAAAPAPTEPEKAAARAALGITDGMASGAVIYVATNTAPTGYLKANGALVSRTTYAALFTAIGTTFGVGDGSTTFALPDLRGEFIRGWSDGRAVDTGRSMGSAQADDLKAHTHTYDKPSYLSAVIPGGSPNHSPVIITGGSATGSTGGTETRPRNIALLACIKF